MLGGDPDMVRACVDSVRVQLSSIISRGDGSCHWWIESVLIKLRNFHLFAASKAVYPRERTGVAHTHHGHDGMCANVGGYRISTKVFSETKIDLIRVTEH